MPPMNSRDKGKKPEKELTFTEALGKAPTRVAKARKDGKQALTAPHAKQVKCTDEHRWSGSLDIDAALQSDPSHAQANRWDYGLGYKAPDGTESAIWVEVHSAETSEIDVVIRKLEWLKRYLQEHCEDLWKVTLRSDASTRFVWLASGRYRIPSHMPQLKRLSSAGLAKPASKLVLP